LIKNFFITELPYSTELKIIDREMRRIESDQKINYQPPVELI